MYTQYQDHHWHYTSHYVFYSEIAYTAWNPKGSSTRASLVKLRKFNLHAKLQHIQDKNLVTKQTEQVVKIIHLVK